MSGIYSTQFLVKIVCHAVFLPFLSIFSFACSIWNWIHLYLSMSAICEWHSVQCGQMNKTTVCASGRWAFSSFFSFCTVSLSLSVVRCFFVVWVIGTITRKCVCVAFYDKHSVLIYSIYVNFHYRGLWDIQMDFIVIWNRKQNCKPPVQPDTF